MPIYEFICKKCKHEFEELVFKRSEKIPCPECGTRKVERAMSVFSSVFSGSDRAPAGSNSCGDCSKGSCSGCSHG